MDVIELRDDGSMKVSDARRERAVAAAPASAASVGRSFGAAIDVLVMCAAELLREISVAVWAKGLLGEASVASRLSPESAVRRMR